MKILYQPDSIKFQPKNKPVQNAYIKMQTQNYAAKPVSYEALRAKILGGSLAFKGKETKDQFRTVISDLMEQTENSSIIRTQKDPALNLDAYIIQRKSEDGKTKITVGSHPNADPVATIIAKESGNIPKFDLVLSKSLPLIQLRDNKDVLTVLACDGSHIKGKDFEVIVGKRQEHPDSKHRLSFAGNKGNQLCLIKGLRPEESNRTLTEYVEKELYKSVGKGDFADNLKQDYLPVGMVGGYGSRLAPIAEIGKHNKPSMYLSGTEYRLMQASILDMYVRAGILDPEKLKTNLREDNIINYYPDEHKVDKNVDTNLILINGPSDKVLNIGYSLSTALIDGVIPVDKPAVFSTSDFLSDIDLSRSLKEFEESNSGYMAINNTISEDEIANQPLMGLKKDESGQWLVNKFYSAAKDENELKKLAKDAAVTTNDGRKRYVTSSNCQVVIIHPKVLQVLKKMFEYNEEESLITFFGTVNKILNGKEKILNKEGKPLASLVEMGVTDIEGNPKGIMDDNGQPLKMTFSFAQVKGGGEAKLRDIGTVDSYIKESIKFAKNENNEYKGFPEALQKSFKELVDVDNGIVYMSRGAKQDCIDSTDSFMKKYDISEMKGSILVTNTYESPKLVALHKRWLNLTEDFGINAKTANQEFQKLMNQYSEAPRAYHTIDHIIDCFGKLDAYLAENPVKLQHKGLLGLAIFFHDFYYLRNREVEDSADYAAKFLEDNGSPEKVKSGDLNILKDIILATQHSQDQKPANLPEIDLMLDLDLSILGGSRDEYNKYSRNVRCEYCKYDDKKYGEVRRTAVLEPFLYRAEKDDLFKNKWFKKRYGNQAITNLKREIENLKTIS